MGSSRVQAGEVSYELHSLGWKAFQQLCLTIVRETWGQTVQGFHDSQDGGRDGAFHGKWERRNHEIYEGSFTVQCKFTTKPGTTLTAAILRDELTKAKRLASKGLSDNYFLFTNAQVTGVADEKIREKFESIPGINRFKLYGYESISQFIRESSSLRMLIPRVYGLGDLSQIMDERAYAQAVEILSSLGDDLDKFVITSAYRRSAKALIDHGFVLLLGEPACGKSTIAAALALGAIDKWGCSAIKVRDADDFAAHSNPHEPKQFFWIDDAFGATQLDKSAATKWNSVFPHLQAAIRRGAKIVLTSRDYIYRSARNHLKESAFPLLHESQVVIQVEKLRLEEREQILYNHIRLGNQVKKFKTQIKPFLPDIAKHQRFSPEIARRIGNPVFTKTLSISQPEVREFVEKPMELLKEIIRTLDPGSRSALAVIFMRGGSLSSPMELDMQEIQAIELLGSTVAEVRQALSALDGSLLIQIRHGADFFWGFKHPTIRDAFASLIAEDRELMDIYLAGTPIETLLGEVSCGNVGMEGVKVIIPADRYEMLIPKIISFSRASITNKDRVNRFLSYRCDREFLSNYLRLVSSFIDGLQIYSYIGSISDMDVITRLHELGLLPESKRLEVLATVRDLAVETPDSGFLDKDIRQLFTETEFQSILEHVKKYLIPFLDDSISNWQFNWNRDLDPYDYFHDLEVALEEYLDIFDGDFSVTAPIEDAIETVREIVSDLQEEEPEELELDKTAISHGEMDGNDSTRSIFDDVDQ